MIGFGIVIPILPFISPRLGASNFDIAMIIASYALCASLAGPLWGRLSDRIGRKPVLMLCTGGAAIGYLLLAYASDLWMIYAARAFAGLMAGNFGVASAMMADVTTPAQRARGMGIVGASFGLGLVLGPVMGGLLSGPEGSFTLPCLVAGVMSALAVISAWRFLPESYPASERQAHGLVRAERKQSLWAMLRETRSRLLLVQYALHTASFTCATYLFPLWAAARLGWTAREVGIVFGVQGAIMAASQGLLIGPLVRSMGELPLLRLCVSLFFVGLLVAVFADGAPAMVGALLVALSGATLCMPVLNSLTSQRTPQEQRGRMMGAASAAASWGRVLGPLLAGLALTFGGFRLAWSMPLLLVAFYSVWAWRVQPLEDDLS
ncbi:MAG: DHA1 family tetracycline resistance protein-like MFS transporter [Halieaceae bacterium]|jgi:DHA1 family tetracycline resistance protein-like MFS transporter